MKQLTKFMVSRFVRKFDQQERVTSDWIFTKSVHSGDIRAPKMNVFQNGGQFFIVVMLELESCCVWDHYGAQNKCHQYCAHLWYGHPVLERSCFTTNASSRIRERARLNLFISFYLQLPREASWLVDIYSDAYVVAFTQTHRSELFKATARKKQPSYLSIHWFIHSKSDLLLLPCMTIHLQRPLRQLHQVY